MAYRVNIRRFLNDKAADCDGGAIILAKVGRSSKAEPYVKPLLKIMDCSRMITLEFNISSYGGNQMRREENIKENKRTALKAAKLAADLQKFADAVALEVDAANARLKNIQEKM